MTAPPPPEDWDAIKTGLGFSNPAACALAAASLIIIPALAICAFLGLL